MHFIGRRNLLAGMGLGAGAHLLGAFWKSTLPQAMGAEPARKRLILFTAANGFLERFYTCPSRSETDFDLTPVFQPVAAHKSKMVVLSKLYNPFSKALHGNQHATLTVMESTNPNVSQKRGPPGGISIDRLIGKKIGAGDSFSSTVTGRGISVSADGAGQSVPLISSPSKAFDTFFGGAAPTPPPGGAMPGPTLDTFQSNFEQDKSFLDLLRSDVSRMNARLAAPERAKLDQYLESLRNLEVQIAKRTMAQTGCTKPGKPADGGVLDQQLIAHIDIAFAAQKCGLTRVSHIAFEGMEGPHITYSWLKDPRNHHDDHHAGDMPILQKIATWWFERIGQMLNHLASTPEGNGTMLDNSLVMFLNTCGGSHHRGYDNQPIVMFGGRRGQAQGGSLPQLPRGAALHERRLRFGGQHDGRADGQVRRPQPLQGTAARPGVTAPSRSADLARVRTDCEASRSAPAPARPPSVPGWPRGPGGGSRPRSGAEAAAASPAEAGSAPAGAP